MPTVIASPRITISRYSMVRTYLKFVVFVMRTTATTCLTLCSCLPAAFGTKRLVLRLIYVVLWAAAETSSSHALLAAVRASCSFISPSHRPFTHIRYHIICSFTFIFLSVVRSYSLSVLYLVARSTQSPVAARVCCFVSGRLAPAPSRAGLLPLR